MLSLFLVGSALASGVVWDVQTCGTGGLCVTGQVVGQPDGVLQGSVGEGRRAERFEVRIIANAPNPGSDLVVVALQRADGPQENMCRIGLLHGEPGRCTRKRRGASQGVEFIVRRAP